MIRDLKMLDVNKKVNGSVILNFHSLLTAVYDEIETCKFLFDTFHSIPGIQIELGMLYKNQCNTCLNGLRSTLQDIEATSKRPTTKLFPTVLRESLLQFEKQLFDIKEKLEKLESVISDLDQLAREAVEPSQDKPDSFNIVNMVPANPKNILLDFDERSGTPESELKELIFDVNSNSMVVIAVIGMCGVDKTCALRAVDRQNYAPARFPGGILYITLGKESGKAELIQNIAAIVRRSDGYRKSKEVRVSKKLEDCVNIAA